MSNMRFESVWISSTTRNTTSWTNRTLLFKNNKGKFFIGHKKTYDSLLVRKKFNFSIHH
jgi:hypothetical protein